MILFFKSNGQHVGHTSRDECTANEIAMMLEARSATSYLATNDPTIDPFNVYLDEGVLVQLPVRPSSVHTFNYTTKQWEDPRTLEQVKRAADQRINAARLQANQTSFTYLGKEIAADPLSRSDIDAINGEVANTGAFPAGWPGGWKCIDNTYVAITTVDDWKAFYTAMVNQGLVNFAHAQTLKAQIAAATTIAEVEAVQW